MQVLHANNNIIQAFVLFIVLDFLGEDCSHVKALFILLKGAFDIRPDEVLLSFKEDHNYSVGHLCLVQCTTTQISLLEYILYMYCHHYEL